MERPVRQGTQPIMPDGMGLTAPSRKRGSDGWRAVIDAKYVSDDVVLRGYSLRLSERSLQRVDSNIFVSKGFERWNVVGNVFSYQDLTTPRPTETEKRLSAGQAVVVIAALSVLAWAVLIAIVVAVHAVL